MSFPGARVTVSPAMADIPSAVKDPLNRTVATVSDALGKSPVYDVIAPATQEEKATASDVRKVNGPLSSHRRVRMLVYHWGQSIVAVLAYTFADSNPPRCCRTMGRVLLLSPSADRILDTFGRVPYAFTTFTELRFLPAAANAAERLILSADYSGVSALGVKSMVLDASSGRLRAVFLTDTLVSYEAELESADIHVLRLAEAPTLSSGGKRFYFSQTVYVEQGKVLPAPRTTLVSYPIETGLPLAWEP